MGDIIARGLAQKALTTTADLSQRVSPTSYSKKIGFFGMSTFAGVGASVPGNAVIQRLQTALETAGWVTYNDSFSSGGTFQALIDMFYTDIVPLNLDVAVFAPTPNNEGLIEAGNKVTWLNSYMAKYRLLAAMCRQVGIIPVAVSGWANDSYTAADYAVVQMLNELLESEMPTLNFLSALDDLAGKYPTGYSGDGLHYNDAGHLAQYNNQNITFFNSLIASRWNNASFAMGSGFALLGEDETAKPMEGVLSTPLESFTVQFDVKNVSADASHNTLLKFGSTGSSRLRVNSSTNVLEYIDNDSDAVIVSTVNPRADTTTINRICVNLCVPTGKARLWVNGVYVGEGADATRTSTDLLSLAGRPDDTAFNGYGYAYRNLLVYRGRLTDKQIKDLAHGKILKQGLEIFCPLNDSVFTNATKLQNLALTDSHLKVNSPNWTYVA